MEVVAAPPPSTGSSPFRDHDVREWSRIDSITGALERARLETDSWAATTRDATHRYGKVNLTFLKLVLKKKFDFKLFRTKA